MQLDFSELGNHYFNITNIFAVEQSADGKTKFIMQDPRPTDALLLFVNSVGICYQDGLPPLYVPQGSLVYLPKNSNYIWENSPAPECSGQKNLLFEFILNHTYTYLGTKNEVCCTMPTSESITLGNHVSIVTTRHTSLYEKLFMKLIESHSQLPHSPLSVFCAAYELLSTVSNNYRIEKDTCVDTRIIKNSIKFLEDPLCDKSIKQIANECNISLGYYERLFYSYSGMTPTEYRDLHRINQIKMMLQTANATLSEIAEKIGYCDSGYLCRIFKKRTGMTPSEYRRVFLAQIQQTPRR